MRTFRVPGRGCPTTLLDGDCCHRAPLCVTAAKFTHTVNLQQDSTRLHSLEIHSYEVRTSHIKNDDQKTHSLWIYASGPRTRSLRTDLPPHKTLSVSEGRVSEVPWN